MKHIVPVTTPIVNVAVSLHYKYPNLDGIITSSDGQAKQKTPSPHPAQDDSLDEHETRNKWLWAGFVIVAMTTYACVTGIVKLKFLNKDTREEEDSEQLPDMAAFSFLDGDDDGYDEGDE